MSRAELSSSRDGRHPGRRRLVVAAALLAAAVVSVLLVVLTGSDDDRPATDAATGATSPSTSGSSTTGSATGTAAAPSSAGDPVAPDAAPPTLAPVGLTDPADAGDGVTVAVTGIESFTSDASGIGNIAGPALRVTVRVTNGTGADLSVDAVSVNLSYGADATPGSPLDDSSQRTFSGTVAPGGSADGVYVFSVPEGERDVVSVEVGHTPGTPVLAFRGPVG